jgi:hypothetical protein
MISFFCSDCCFTNVRRVAGHRWLLNRLSYCPRATGPCFQTITFSYCCRRPLKPVQRRVPPRANDDLQNAGGLDIAIPLGLHPRRPKDDIATKSHNSMHLGCQFCSRSSWRGRMNREDVANPDADALKGSGNMSGVAASGNAGSWREAGTRARERLDSTQDH